MKRPKPTEQLIVETCGENLTLISSLHHGLYEVSLARVYPHLDFDEAIAFAASSWKEREKNPAYAHIVKVEDTYEIFNQVLLAGIPWLRKYREMSAQLQPRLAGLNPYKGRDLGGRLARLDLAAVEALRSDLARPVKTYVFECQHDDTKRSRGGDRDIVVMGFQNAYPPTKKKGHGVYERQFRGMIGRFGAEIAKMFSKYPQEFDPLDSVLESANPVRSPFD